MSVKIEERETPITPGCPSLMPRQLPGGFDGGEPGEVNHGLHGLHGLPSGSNPCKSVKSVVDEEDLEKRLVNICACNERSRARIFMIKQLALEVLLNTNHPNGYEAGQYGRDYRAYGKAMCEIRKLVKESIADVDPDYEMLALQFARKTFDFAKFQEALAAQASMSPEDFPGVYYTPDWLVRFAREQLGETRGTGVSPVRADKGADGANGRDARSTEHPLTPEERSALQREEARLKRKIHWKCYETKVDLAAMGKTDQNSKVYEVRINKRTSEVTTTYWECKVNGTRVFQGWFLGSAWMAKAMLTAAMQALVNHKAKWARDKRRYYERRDAAKAAAEKKEVA